jgi:hypothetical protein
MGAPGSLGELPAEGELVFVGELFPEGEFPPLGDSLGVAPGGIVPGGIVHPFGPTPLPTNPSLQVQFKIRPSILSQVASELQGSESHRSITVRLQNE